MFNQHSVEWDCVNQQIAVFIFGSPVSLFCMYPVFCAFLYIFVFFELSQRSSFLDSFRYWVETMCTPYKWRANIKTCTMLYYIDVLLVSLVWIFVDLSFFNCFPWNIYGSSKSNIDISFWASMCSTFSLLVIEWKLCAHTTSDVQTSKLAQRYTILACCWYHWCEYCRFVIFPTVFPEIFM